MGKVWKVRMRAIVLVLDWDVLESCGDEIPEAEKYFSVIGVFLKLMEYIEAVVDAAK